MNGRAVSTDDRKTFLMWLGSNHEFKQPQAVDVLRFFLSTPENLTRLRIIDDGSYSRPLLLISTLGQRQPGLLYQTASGSSTAAPAILMDLALTQRPVYLTPFFPHRTQAKLFLRAREEGTTPASGVFGPALVDLETTQLLADLSLEVKRTELLFLIDQALERRDRIAFAILVAELKKWPSRQDLAVPGLKKSL